MPRSIAEIRRANGGLANLTDEEILVESFKDYAPYYKSVDDYARAVGYGGAGRGMASSRISAGVDNYQAGLLGLGGAVSRAVGLEAPAQFFDRRREANEQAAAYATQRARDLGAVDDWREVDGVGSGLNYLGGLAAQSLPYLGEAVAGGLAARGLATGARAALRGATTAEEAAAAGRQLGAIQTGGAVAASYPSAVGDILGAQREAGGEDLGMAALGGVPYAAMNALGVEGLAARGFRPLATGQGGLARRVATGAGVTALGEGIGETGQELTNQFFGRMAVDPNETLFNEEANRRYLDSFVGGAALGGALGGVGGIRRPRTVDQGQFDITNPQNNLGYDSPFGTGADRIREMPGFTGATGFNDNFLDQARQGIADRTQPPADTESGVASTQQVGKTPTQTAPALLSESDLFYANTVQMPLPSGKSRQAALTQLYDNAVASGVPVDSPALEPYWNQISTGNYYGKNQQAKLRVLLQNAIVEHRKGAANVSQPSAPAGQPAASGVGGSAAPVGGMGNPGSVPDVRVGAGGNAGDTQPAGGQAAPVADAGVQRPAVVGENTSILAGANPAPIPNQESMARVRAMPGFSGDDPNAAFVSGMRVANPQPTEAPTPADPFQVSGEPVVQRKRRKVTVQPGAQPTAYVTPEAPAPKVTAPVAEDGYVNDEDAWEDFRPDVSPSFGDLSPGLQKSWGELRRMGKLSRETAEQITAEHEVGDTESGETIRDVINQIFDKRDADIIHDVFVENLPAAQVAEKYGLNASRVRQIAGTGKEGQSYRNKRIKAAQEKFGWTDEYVRGLMGDLGGADSNVELDSDLSDGRTAPGIEDDNSQQRDIASFGATGDMTLGDVGMSTISSEGGSTGYKDTIGDRKKVLTKEEIDRLNTMRDGRDSLERDLAEAKNSGDEGLAERIQGDIDELTTKIEKLESGKASPQEMAASLSQEWYDLTAKADELERRVRAAQEAGLDTLTDTKKNKRPLAEVQQEIADIQAKAAKALEKAKKLLEDLRAAVPQSGKKADAPKKETKPKTEKKTSTAVAVAKPKQDSGQTLWEKLRAQSPDLVAYDELTANERGYLTELADRTNGKPKLKDEVGLQELMKRQAPAQIANDNVIDVEARVIEETVGAQVAALPAPRVQRLENHYGVKSGTQEFLERVKEDVVRYATEGAQAVSAAIRDIIKAIHTGVLSVAMIFNPNFVTPPQLVVLDEQVMVETRDVRAEVPANAQARMSDGAKEVYSVLYPSIKQQLQSQDKLMVIVDKPNARMFVFKPDGSLLIDKKVLLGAAKGDLYKGNNDVKANRVTPAGLFTMGLRDATRSAGEARTAGEYDFQKVFVLDKAIEGEYSVTLLHSVWTKEKDAQQRLNALKTEGAGDSRYSFGCINVDKDTYGSLVKNHLSQMDGAALFIVPENSADTAEFLKGATAQNKSGADGLTRTTFTPATETTTTRTTIPAASKQAQRGQVGREEETPAQTGAVRFSKQGKKAATKNTVARIVTTMESAFKATFGNFQHEDFVRIHQTAEEAFQAAGKKVPMNQLRNAQAFVDPADQRVVHLIADNIPVGHEFAVLLHDVGVHVGLKGQMGALFKVLESQVKSWAKSPKDSLEYKVYEAAMARVAAGRLEGSIDPNDVGEELVAYAAEEAVARGVKPQASSNKKLERWLAQLKTIVEKALKNFFKIDTVPDVSAQDLVNFAYAAASQQMQEYRREPGAAQRDNPTQVIRFYANRGSLPDDARLERLGDPGEEHFYWGSSSKYAGFTDIGTAAELRTVKTDGSVPDVRVFSMVVTSAESREIGKQTGFGEDKVLQSFEAVEDPKTKVWSLMAYGPMKDSALYNDLWYWNRASTTKDVDGEEWTRLDGVGMRDNLRILSEFRRRLTRAIGNVPYVDWTRVTASGTNIEGGEGRYNSVNPETLATRFSKAAPTASTIEKTVAKLPKQVQKPARTTANALTRYTRKGLDMLAFTSDLAKRATAAGVKSAEQFQALMNARATKTREYEREVERIADMYAEVPERDRGDGPTSVNQFIFDSTQRGQWGYDSGKFKANDEMAERFDKLDPKSQAFVKAVFAHGDRMLALKKQTVLDFTSSEYDAHIKALNDLIKGGTLSGVKLKEAQDELAEVQKDKKADLDKFSRLFSLREGKPYAPIKRFGPYAVVAKSATYLQAVEDGDNKAIRKLEQDANHYHVTFTESASEAEGLADKLMEQGAFEQVQHFERSVSEDGLFGNDNMMAALTALRSRVNSMDRAGTAQLKNLVSQMYLQELAENSARKSEMRRRGVVGEIDMLRSFTTQGRADAHFMASTRYGSEIQDVMQAMHKEARQATNRTRASEALNEVVRRYQQSFDYAPTPWIDKLRRMSSIYFLATSPAYYMQNLTQPWMMSVPAMAGAHDYMKVSAELFKAYGQMKDVVKSGKLLNQMFDYTAVPGDVRSAIQELVNRGKIDIGMDTELGEFRVEGRGPIRDRLNQVDKALRIAVQKVESINRLSTAMAAYRLERSQGRTHEQAITYADRILTETHGDYTAFNAPRVFNTQFGKVALQFRKFQLIQLTYYAKLINDVATNPRERRAAAKMLAYSLGHTALLAGVRGLPGFAAVAFLASKLFGDDDEPFDLEAEIRKAVGDPTMANLVMRGAPTLAGADISGKVGAGNMLSIMPFSDADLTTRAGVAQAVGTLLGGASLGMATRMIDGLGLVMSGDLLRGTELLMPKGVGDAVKAYRIGSEGMTRRNGDILLSPEEVSFWESSLQAMGIQPVQQAVVFEQQQRVKDMDKNFQDRSTKIKADYIKAVREKDTEAMAEAREAWTKMQEARVRNGYTRQPMSSLLKAPQEQTKRERNTIDGVQFNQQNRRFVESQI